MGKTFVSAGFQQRPVIALSLPNAEKSVEEQHEDISNFEQRKTRSATKIIDKPLVRQRNKSVHIETESEESSDEDASTITRRGPPVGAKKRTQERHETILEPTKTTKRPFRAVPTVRFVDPEIEPVEKSYKNVAPNDRPSRHGDLARQIMRTPMTTEVGELLGASPAVWKEVQKLNTRKRIPVQPYRDSGPKELEAALRVRELNLLEPSNSDYGIPLSQLPEAQCYYTQEAYNGIPKGSLIVGDPFLQYLESLPDGQEPENVFAASESQSLRTIHPLINGTSHVESILDGGSQIVSMSADIARKLALSYNPDIVIQMQSANRQIQPTLGLARNVPFLCGEITIYLQVHIIEKPAYKVLLGRPFDVITQSVIKNQSDGGQTITLKDPSSGNRVLMPTFARGSDPKPLRREGFH